MEIERKKRLTDEEIKKESERINNYVVKNQIHQIGTLNNGVYRVQPIELELHLESDDNPIFGCSEMLVNDWSHLEKYYDRKLPATTCWLPDDHWEYVTKLINDRKERNWDVMTENLHFDLKDYAWS